MGVNQTDSNMARQHCATPAKTFLKNKSVEDGTLIASLVFQPGCSTGKGKGDVEEKFSVGEILLISAPPNQLNQISVLCCNSKSV